SVPGYAEFVAKAPEQIVLTFDEPVRPIAGNAVVEGSSLSVLSGPPRTAPGRPNVLLLPLRAGLTDGYYTARWRVLSDDGHKVQGLLPFAIGKEHGPLRPSLPLLSTSTGPWDLAGRWLFLVGVIGALGAFAFAALVWRPALAALAFESEQVHALRAAELRRRSALLFGCFLLSQFGSALAIQYATTGTRYGRIHELAILIAGAGAASAAFQSRTAQLLAGGAAVALAATPSLSGHALDSGRSQPLTLIAD